MKCFRLTKRFESYHSSKPTTEQFFISDDIEKVKLSTLGEIMDKPSMFDCCLVSLMLALIMLVLFAGYCAISFGVGR